MSDRITIKGIEGYGFHGVFDYEKCDGQTFYVDLEVSLDLRKASESDNLDDTVNYALFTLIARQAIEGEPFNLIEKLAGTIADQIIAAAPQVERIEVTVHKPKAPVDEKVTDISVTIVRP
jgi:dihydroneopterin aldolase